MKTKCFLVTIILFFFSIQYNFAHKKLWHSGTIEQSNKIKKYYAFSLDTIALKNNLFNTPIITLALPTPEGNEQIFILEENELLAPELKAKFSQIKSYTGYIKTNPEITIKAEWTTHGFSAMVFDYENTYIITSEKNTTNYKVYYKKDYIQTYQHECKVNNDKKIINDEIIEINPPKHKPLIQHGSQRKRYRLALSCTGEYAVAVDGASPTVAGVLSAMVKTINRVNGIYERELAVTMQLIGNNDTLIFLSGSSDPFTNNNAGIMLLQNQSVVNARIGINNYDIGHIFSTGGGGLATIYSVCENAYKAQGVTGSNEPYNDPYDVDYVAHEMGHQFGANHTQNSCSNEELNAAFEPGSGSTIMGYAGLCGINNIQRNSSDYFHANSIREILSLLNLNASCGNTLTGHTPPSPFSINQTYFIPANTAFELIAPKQDGLHYYNWFQWNLGNFKENENQSANFNKGPNFRSYKADTSGIRVFPKLDSLLANKYSILGERISKVNRKLNFKLLVRKMENNWGAFYLSDDTLKVEVVNTGEPFTVTFPNTNAHTLNVDTINEITWNTANTQNSPINCSHVDIYLSIDGGYTYPIVLATEVENTGSALVTLPPMELSNRARIKIKSHNNIFFDISNANFKLVEKNGYEKINGIVIYPNPTKDYLYIKHGYNAAQNDISYRLYDNIGRLIMSKKLTQNTTPINTRHLASGVYVLKVNNQTTNEEIIKKIMIK